MRERGIQADGLVEMNVMLRGRGKKKKTGNPHESLASESEKGRRVNLEERV